MRELRLAELRFDPNVRSFDPSVQPVEKGLLQARRLISWADHIVFVYPTWWGTMPALLKGFLDRVLAPGFAFAETDRGFAPLLGGRSAELLTTMDTPRWVYRWIYGAPGHKAMARAILGFCGIEIARVASFGPVKDSDLEQRQNWLEQAQRRGQRTAPRRVSHPQSDREEGGELAAGAAPAVLPHDLARLPGRRARGHGARRRVRRRAVLVGPGVPVLHRGRRGADQRALRRRDGSSQPQLRSVHGRLPRAGRRQAQRAGGAGRHRHGARARSRERRRPGPGRVGADPRALLALAVLTVLALGYTAPPFKLSYRGLGELDVGLTHSLGAMLCGFVIQGGPWSAPEPWLLSVPLCLAVLPGITLSGVPDHDADRLAGKRTLAVRTGVSGAYLIAANCTALAAAAAIALAHVPALADAFAGIEYGVLPHAAILLLMLACHAQENAGARRIDGLMAVALSYVLWFVAVPLFNLM